MALLKRLAHAEREHGLDVVAVWLPREFNVVPDALSKGVIIGVNNLVSVSSHADYRRRVEFHRSTTRGLSTVLQLLPYAALEPISLQKYVRQGLDFMAFCEIGNSRRSS